MREVVGAEGQRLGRRPKDLYTRLAELALAGPAVVALRALTNLYGHKVERTDAAIRVLAGQVAYAFRSYVNLPEVTALIRALEPAGDYWKQVLAYCVRAAGSARWSRSTSTPCTNGSA
ncbi:MAG: hypothetical protein IPG75_15675 [Gemmatimonadetes bacterium]|nr:hypothetical protein [Gemmatimonadota bacterium]